MTPTATKRAFVLDRDADQRAGQGGMRQLISFEVIGTPNGDVYGNFPPPKGPGPLDGQPVKYWTVVFRYSDGTSNTVGGFGIRTVPAFA